MSGLACGELSGPPSHGPEQREGKNRSQTTTNPVLRPAHRFHLSRRDSVRRASPWLCHPGSDTEAEVGGQLGRGWGGEKCPSKGFEVGSVEWAREGRNLPPRLSGSGVEGSREGQLWPGRDWQEHEEDCSRYSIHCPFIAQVTPGVQGTCVPRKSPVIGEVTQKRPRPALDHK